MGDTVKMMHATEASADTQMKINTHFDLDISSKGATSTSNTLQNSRDPHYDIRKGGQNKTAQELPQLKGRNQIMNQT